MDALPRSVRDAPLTTRAARERLVVRHQPYWRGIDSGAAIGYRKGPTGGVWLVRVTDRGAGGGYRQSAIGRADDSLFAAGVAVLAYRQAETKAREWVARHHRVMAGMEPEASLPSATCYTVADALNDYLADYSARGGKAYDTTRLATDAHIRPQLGSLPVGRLTRDQLKSWHRALASSPARLRSRPDQTRYREIGNDPEAARRRQSSANRILTILKAALNHARSEGKATCPPDAWTAVRAFREVDSPKIRYLLDDEIVRLVNACPPDFRQLVTGAVLTGCRYGELATMVGGDFDPQSGTITIGRSKGGKPRHIALTDEGQTYFKQATAGRPGMSRVFERNGMVRKSQREPDVGSDRIIWGKSDQFRFIRRACAAARIAPAVTFHELRHTYASRLAMRGVPMGVIAAQLGHSDTRMTERHYAHLSPTYVAETVRRSFGSLGIVRDIAVESFHRSTLAG